ncbi:MAG TPA: hypothetical protein VMD29_14560 [Terracidiphilus sp.]|nr:hypothetical protein [Terracidiphilus sp.]
MSGKNPLPLLPGMTFGHRDLDLAIPGTVRRKLDQELAREL